MMMPVGFALLILRPSSEKKVTARLQMHWLSQLTPELVLAFNSKDFFAH